MINAVIIEDEPRNVTILRKMLQSYCPQIDICGEAGSVETAFQILKKLKPELVFLDIEMPGGNAFSLLDKLLPISFEIIFVTAYNNYALQAIKYSALDYLLKPINIEELIQAVTKITEKVGSLQLQQRIETLLININSAKKNLQSIAIPANFGYEFINVPNIIRCEAKGGYTFLFIDDERKIVSAKSLKEYEDILPPEIFFRIHHSHLINVKFIKRYHKGKGGIIEMKDNIKIPLAYRRKKEFLSLFMAED